MVTIYLFYLILGPIPWKLKRSSGFNWYYYGNQRNNPSLHGKLGVIS